MRLMLGILLALLSIAARADEPPPPHEGELGASYLANAGNTKNSTLGVWGDVTVRAGAYKLRSNAGFIRATSDDIVSSRRAFAGLRTERTLSSRMSADVRGEYQQDTPAGTRSMFTVSAGGLCRVVRRETHSLSVSASLAQTWERRVIAPDRYFLGAQGGLEFHLAINELVSLDHEDVYIRDLRDDHNWRLKSSTSLEASLNRHFALKVAHQLYRNKPDPGRHAIDSSVMGSLVMHWPAKSAS